MSPPLFVYTPLRNALLRTDSRRHDDSPWKGMVMARNRYRPYDGLTFAVSIVMALLLACSSEPEIREVIKEVPVEKIVTQEVVKEVPVEKVVTKEVPGRNES